jgi:hypothetical protein
MQDDTVLIEEAEPDDPESIPPDQGDLGEPGEPASEEEDDS